MGISCGVFVLLRSAASLVVVGVEDGVTTNFECNSRFEGEIGGGVDGEPV